MNKVVSAREAVKLIKDGDTVAFGGFVGAAHAEEVTAAIQASFLESAQPRDLTVVYAAGQGDGKERGLNHLGEEGLVKRIVGGHWGLVPRLQKLALENKLSAYNLPQGIISHLFRDIAAGKLGVLTHVGLKTFADPRLEGGKINDVSKKDIDLVKVVNIDGEERLLYKAFPVNVGIIRATYADTQGNCTMEHEGALAESLAIAQAAKNSGGKVIVQVKQVMDYGSLDARLVKIPGIYVDAIVVAGQENHRQTFGTYYNPAYNGETRVPVDSLAPLPLSERKIIARRAAMELIPDAVV
ncbi:MAG: hypothetical protein IKA80_01300, partial [Spirochaetaceae bacterium]|nr:hypothetical protein [Spirochaetaceae bacterium]